MARLIDLVGRKIGHLSVIAYSHVHTQPCGAKCHYWKARCECGAEVVRRSTHLLSAKNGNSSCGCKVPELVSKRFKSHGLREHPLYGTWSKMLKRCSSPKDRFWTYYGGRGIYVCERWETLENFLADMGPKPGPRYSLDRINNDGPYSPENCRWATPTEQAANRRGLHKITINGETKTLTEWCRLSGLRPSVACQRISCGWPEDVAVTCPKTRRATPAFRGGDFRG